MIDRCGTTEAINRPGLVDAVGELARASGIVVWKLDRLARDVIVQENFLRDLKRQGKRLWSTSPSENEMLYDDDADPSRKMIRTVLGAVATYEKEMAVIRMTLGRRRKAAKGGFAAFGSPPFGTASVHGELMPVDSEAATIRRIDALHRDGYSLRAICTALTAEDHRTKRGGTWHPPTVSRIITRIEHQR